MATAEQLAEIAPAAAPAAAGPLPNTGAGFDPYDPGSQLPGIDDLGPLGPTELGFGAPEPEGRVFPEEEGEALNPPVAFPFEKAAVFDTLPDIDGDGKGGGGDTIFGGEGSISNIDSIDQVLYFEFTIDADDTLVRITADDENIFGDLDPAFILFADDGKLDKEDAVKDGDAKGDETAVLEIELDAGDYVLAVSSANGGFNINEAVKGVNSGKDYEGSFTVLVEDLGAVPPPVPDEGFFAEFDVGGADDGISVGGSDLEDGLTVLYTITSLPSDGILIWDSDDDGVYDTLLGVGDTLVPDGDGDPDDLLYIFTGEVPPPTDSFTYTTTDSDLLVSAPATVPRTSRSARIPVVRTF